MRGITPHLPGAIASTFERTSSSLGEKLRIRSLRLTTLPISPRLNSERRWGDNQRPLNSGQDRNNEGPCILPIRVNENGAPDRSDPFSGMHFNLDPVNREISVRRCYQGLNLAEIRRDRDDPEGFAVGRKKLNGTFGSRAR